MVRLLALYTTLSLANAHNYVLVTYLFGHCCYLVQHLFEGIPCYAVVHLTQATFPDVRKNK